MSDLSRLARWLRCPECGRDLASTDGVLACTSGHRFEPNKRGYAALVRGRSGLRSDGAAELDRREAHYGTGDGLALVSTAAAMLSHGRDVRLLDSGNDLGRLLASALSTLPGSVGLSISPSPTALVRAMALTRADGLLCDTDRPWPVRDGAASVLLALEVPHHPQEWHRVLAPGGTAVVSPADAEASDLLDDVYPWFEHDQSREAGGTTVLRLRRRRRPLQF